MIITIVGWYGTETIGDRAILAGIFSFLNSSIKDFEVELGSLHPFFSERTLVEDQMFWNEILGKKIKVNIFNSKKSKELNEAIKKSNIILMGGGPLMDVSAMPVIEYAFLKAKKSNKKTIVYGSGIGPLYKKENKKSVLNVINNSDLVILRDEQSKSNLDNLFKEFNIINKNKNIYTSFDPAVKCCLEYKKINFSTEKNVNKYICINLREFDNKYSQNKLNENINNIIIDFIRKLSLEFSSYTIKLIPMHYFIEGGDDREYFYEIKQSFTDITNIQIQDKPLSLYETMNLYENAEFNIGMRFHSAVLQTILSNKNYIIDYTEPNKGKVSGFLELLGEEFYYKRYVNIQNEDFSLLELFEEIKVTYKNSFKMNNQDIDKKMDIYIEKIRDLVD